LGRVSVSVTDPSTCLSPSWSPIAAGDVRVYTRAGTSPGLPQPETRVFEEKGFKFEDARGSYERLEYPGGEYVNLVYTRAGHKRSGDIHKCAQVNTLIVGEAFRNSGEQRRQREKNEAEGRGPRRDSSARAAPVRVHQGHADDRVVDAQGAGEGAGAVPNSRVGFTMIFGAGSTRRQSCASRLDALLLLDDIDNV
jgi:hypothetical protein